MSRTYRPPQLGAGRLTDFVWRRWCIPGPYKCPRMTAPHCPFPTRDHLTQVVREKQKGGWHALLCVHAPGRDHGEIPAPSARRAVMRGKVGAARRRGEPRAT
jgi:hypothetical protein